MNPYPSYKETGVEWIGEIPSGWDIIRTKFLTDNLDGRRVPLNSEERGKILGDYPYWGSNGVVGYVDDYLFDEELVLVGEDGSPFFERYKDVSFYLNNKVWVNNHIHVLRNKDGILPKILVHSFNCVNYRNFITGSTRDKLNQSDLKNIPHPVPPLQEQQQISNYLDHKTQQIDSLIEKTQQKIELLKEQRTSMINQVVTKGLNPDVEMKDSGVEWIGEIPSGWNLLRLGFVSKPFQGIQLDVDKQLFEREEGSERFLRISDYTTDEEPRFIKPFPIDCLVEETDLIMVRYGSKSGKVYRGIRGVICNNVFRVEVTKKVNPDFLFYFLNQDLFYQSIEINRDNNTLPQVSHTLYKNERIPLPPISEQQQIVDHLDKGTTKIDSTIEKETQRINLLKEYRQSLISEVVTGKVDVRDEVVV